jgi:polyhydroxyalkanoate synthesis regulator phasin
MSRTTRSRDLKRLSHLQEKVKKIEKSNDDPYTRSQLRQVKKQLLFARTDITHLHERVEELEDRVTALEERNEE